MRVIAGTAKKTKLIAPKGVAVRPTGDRVKEALFNIFGLSVVDCSFLDLFAGTGSVGIEALSRGAGRAVFVEQEKSNMPIIHKNLQVTGLEKKAECMCLPVSEAIPLLGTEKRLFEFVFMDPPYSQNLVLGVFHCLRSHAIVAPGGVLVVESGRKDLPPETGTGAIQLLRRERYGDTVLSFYQFQ